MIQYFNLFLILVLIIIAVLILLDLKKKKDSDGDVYSKSDHEGFRDKIITFIATALGLPWQSSLAIAIILSLSSTAIALQTLTEKKLQHTEGGKSATAILLMQDVAVIPILAILPLLGLQELQVDALLARY